tara:strand:- start:2032 stop:2775 length:744 start_codon:yes stop_codon:yes gene_type:complete
MITLTTILYEGNFEKTLTDDCWFFQFNSELITNKLIVVNNITSVDLFWEKVGDLKKIHSFDVVMVKGNESIIDTYNLSIDESTIGYVYTIPYFVLIESVPTEFILHVATDCMGDILVDDDFLLKGINEIKTNPLCSTTMISWVTDNKLMDFNGLTVGQYEENETSDDVSTGEFNYTKGFTDQFFMGKLTTLKSINYNLPSQYSNTYKGPVYGGNCFEKRMVAHQNYNSIYNCVFKGKQYYIHDNVYY